MVTNLKLVIEWVKDVWHPLLESCVDNKRVLASNDSATPNRNQIYFYDQQFVGSSQNPKD